MVEGCGQLGTKEWNGACEAILRAEEGVHPISALQMGLASYIRIYLVLTVP